MTVFGLWPDMAEWLGRLKAQQVTAAPAPRQHRKRAGLSYAEQRRRAAGPKIRCPQTGCDHAVSSLGIEGGVSALRQHLVKRHGFVYTAAGDIARRVASGWREV